MSGEATPDAFALSRRLYARWIQSLSVAADAAMRSRMFLLWMQYGIKATIEARKLQAWWFPRPTRVDQSTSSFP